MTPWEEQWERKSSLAMGGQGHTFVVARRDGSVPKAVLKLLLPRKAKDPKARRRMHQEATNLEILHNAGGKVPKVLDSNTAAYEAIETEMHLVMEYIDGTTLAECVEERRSLSLEESLGIARDLCATLQVAVKENITHRDIKPENIVVRSLTPADVVMVDFGLSFNADEPVDLTQTDEALDNAFISLPERRGPAENKRDPRSDITGVCAILHFCLTGCRPRNLRDSQNRPPHRWPDYTLDARVADTAARSLLIALFDKAFEYEIANRIQTVDELCRRLVEIDNPPAQRPVEDLKTIVARAGQDFTRRDRKTQISLYNTKLVPLTQAMKTKTRAHGSECQRSGLFKIEAGTASPPDAVPSTGEALNYAHSVSVKASQHGLRFVIAYRVFVERQEGIVFRYVGRLARPNAKLEPVVPWTAISRFSAIDGPDPDVVVQDLEAQLCRAVQRLRDEILAGSGDESGIPSVLVGRWDHHWGAGLQNRGTVTISQDGSYRALVSEVGDVHSAVRNMVGKTVEFTLQNATQSENVVKFDLIRPKDGSKESTQVLVVKSSDLLDGHIEGPTKDPRRYQRIK